MLLTTQFRNTVLNNANKVGIIDGDAKFTYGEFGERVKRLAGKLQEMGVEKGDRVGLLMFNSFRYLEIFYASFLLGAVVVPLNIRLAPPEISFILNDAGAKVLFFHREFIPVVSRLRAELPAISHYVLAEEVPAAEANAVFYEDLVSEPVSLREAALADDDLAGIYYTGGTTGLPKGVMLSHKNLAVNAYQVAVAIGYRHDDVYLHAAPMFHAADGASTFAVTMVGGIHAHIRSFDPRLVLETIQREHVTSVLLVPTMINMVVNHPDVNSYTLSSLKKLMYGASPIPAEVLKKAIEVLGCEFFQAYGMTEASPCLTILRSEHHVVDGSQKDTRRLASCGQALFNVDLKIVDPEGREVPYGVVGEIIARGPNIMKGYWNRPEETAAALKDGWYWSGDMGAMDEDRFVYIIDRKKDMIITGGENVYSVEVENVIYQHPAVLEAAVIGVPDEKWGEAVKAVVVLKPGQTVSAEELIEFCGTRLANYKVPKSVDFVEALPKSGAGKILKRTLRDQYWEGRTRQVN
ncbi:fatty acid--CoA ligase [Effusibacillus lacus]|uniref:Fatty-acid--CoA ligase n=1 Tax=Effusibacillus lacus TaxID=1348429 RepID=A0A292YJ85_9BACL|nr:fatty acid--CoA ligase [Effusibacillus lacus]TCS75504.1 long-chain acyl-CoA synthetase [Effusibacillus lacus]GAX88969.1 fatty-acid--CoA ligase [Effusibacillus lacus]